MDPTEADLQSFLQSLGQIARAAQDQRRTSGELVSDRLREFFGVDPGSCPVVAESVEPSRRVDADLALTAMVMRILLAS